MRSRADYDRVFEAESAVKYPVVDAVEQEYGYALDPERLLPAARVLACPVKTNPPNWQHGRVLYAVARNYFEKSSAIAYCVLDIGTAKGFSALCLRWAAKDAEVTARVHSVDVVRPDERTWRNTVLEADRSVPLTLPEILAEFPDAADVQFHGMTALNWLLGRAPGHVHLAFVDGKHTGHVVRQEAQMLADRQESGNVIMFDDVHLPDVRQAAWSSLGNAYERRVIEILPKRAYMICRKK